MGKSIKYKECITAFLDILGFKNFVENTLKDETLLKNLIDTMSLVGSVASSGGEKKVQPVEILEKSIYVNVFSDSLVFFIKKNHEDIAEMFFLIRYIQDQLWEKGYCLRGGITLDKMYWPIEDDNITVGPAMIEAYELEQKAEFPRIVLSENLYKYIKNKKTSAAPFGLNDDLINLIVKDENDIFFLDLLNPQIVRFKGELLKKPDKNNYYISYNKFAESNHPKAIQDINKIIDEHIENSKSEIKEKYEWLKSYVEGR